MKLLLSILIIFLFGCSYNQAFDLENHTEALRLVDQGTQYLRLADLDRAEAAFRVAVQLEQLPRAYDGLGCVAFLRGEYLEAEKYFINAYQIGDNYSHALANLALLYESQGLLSKASQLYVRAIKENPKNVSVRNNYAVHLFEIDNRGSSILAQNEFLEAQALVNHPLIEDNLSRVKDKSHGRD